MDANHHGPGPASAVSAENRETQLLFDTMEIDVGGCHVWHGAEMSRMAIIDTKHDKACAHFAG